MCHFRPQQEGGPTVSHREVVRWFAPNRGYASMAAEPNGFGLRNCALQDEARRRGDLLSVAQLTSAVRARMVRAQAGAHQVTDGPYLETKEWLVGFYFVECDDESEAIARAKLLCDDSHSIEVRPVAWRWAR